MQSVVIGAGAASVAPTGRLSGPLAAYAAELLERHATSVGRRLHGGGRGQRRPSGSAGCCSGKALAGEATASVMEMRTCFIWNRPLPALPAVSDNNGGAEAGRELPDLLPQATDCGGVTERGRCRGCRCPRARRLTDLSYVEQ